MEFDRAGLAAWQAGQPLSVLQLDTADRTVLRVAGTTNCTVKMSPVVQRSEKGGSLL